MPIGASEAPPGGRLIGFASVWILCRWLGFSLGRLSQVSLYEHQDRIHLVLNAESLMTPLIVSKALIADCCFLNGA
jgi:hypothetical protein